MKIPYLDLEPMHRQIREQLDHVYETVLERESFIWGKYCAEFEQNFASFCGAKYCIGVGNGLDAIRLILQGMGIGEGDEVIVPANTFIATVLAVTYVGATPVLVDADIETYNIDLQKIEEKITPKTKAVICVHLYGGAVDVEALQDIKQRYQVKIIEDAAQAHGAMINGKRVGSLGDAAAFSFYPGKNLGALGDAGAIVTQDEKLAERIRAISNYGSYEKYVHVYKGCNSRLDELQAGFLYVKLSHLDAWNKERRNIAGRYNKEIRNSLLRLPVWDGVSANHVFHIYPVLCPERERLKQYLYDKGIATNIHYPTPIFMQGAYQEMRDHADEFPVTSRICREEISIPLYPGLSEEQQNYVIDTLNSFEG